MTALDPKKIVWIGLILVAVALVGLVILGFVNGQPEIAAGAATSAVAAALAANGTRTKAIVEAEGAADSARDAATEATEAGRTITHDVETTLESLEGTHERVEANTERAETASLGELVSLFDSDENIV